MDKTLFTAPMIETFNVCRRAYKFAFGQGSQPVEVSKSSSVCKRFLLKALAEVNRGRITTVQQVQKFMGQNWPADKLSNDEAVKAFLFSYKALIGYLQSPYKPQGAEVVGVDLKIRARIPHDKVYVEDTFDVILWHPQERKLEFVDYHLHPLKPFNHAWPTPSILVKQFLAERLHSRWPFEKLCLTFCRISPEGSTLTSVNLEESLYKVHWPELLKVIEEMKCPSDYHPHRNTHCNRCTFLSQCRSMSAEDPAVPVTRTA